MYSDIKVFLQSVCETKHTFTLGAYNVFTKLFQMFISVECFFEFICYTSVVFDIKTCFFGGYLNGSCGGNIS